MRVVLSVRGLHVHYATRTGLFRVVEDAWFDLRENEVLGLAGESGCGKSTVVEGILRLVRPPGRIVAGEVVFHGRTGDPVELVGLGAEAVRRLRWRGIAYVPQGSMNSLNPVLRIEDQFVDTLVAHGQPRVSIQTERLVALLGSVGLPAHVLNAYPHQLSGGMRQRVLIANSLALAPDVVVADEPTTGLDVHAQRLVIEALLMARREYRTAFLFVSHDLAVHAQLVDRVAVMYAGQIVESGPAVRIYEAALHPYTRGLIGSLPRVGGGRRRLTGIPGLAPSPMHWPQGCRFHTRCPFAFDRCHGEVPQRVEVSDQHAVSCHLYDPGERSRLTDAQARMDAGGEWLGARVRG